MPDQVKSGSVGASVRHLQSCLNRAFPKLSPALAIDAIFGPKTNARVVQFQKQAALAVDGIVGPKTWSALATALPKIAPPTPTRRFVCGTCDAGNARFAPSFAENFQRVVADASTLHAFGRTPGTKLAALAAAPNIRCIEGEPQETTARTVYGGSLDYSKIYMTDMTGLQNRPFTVAVKPPMPGPFPNPFSARVILNLGTLSPSRNLLIHELAHAWQSQHGFDPFTFMSACVRCQAAALAANLVEGELDPSVKSHKDFPANYPFSAYGFRPGSELKDYGGEQVAEAIELGETAVVSHAAGVSANAFDGQNEKSLTHTRFEDLRDSGVKI